MSLSATFASPITSLSVAGSEDRWLKQKKNVCFIPAGLRPLHLHFQPLRTRESARPVFRVKYTSICAVSLNATCAAQQTQTVTRQSSTVTIAPIQWNEKSRKLDDGGIGFPPLDDDGGVGDRGGGDDDDGGGGRGGDGGHWSGGFFLFAFLAFLSFLKDQESEEHY
ncbi:uncharacterized protein [Primulina eburnea]|uniref:uncharacterized protein isoform X1 n=1 Tax=Primulina eburnea TaxID=1245227 RepID=UPI003C6C1C3D